MAVKRILRYLKGTINYGLMYSNNDKNDKTITEYPDADWAGDANDQESTSDYLFMVSGAPVSWKADFLLCPLTAEAEHVVLAYATQN